MVPTFNYQGYYLGRTTLRHEAPEKAQRHVINRVTTVNGYVGIQNRFLLGAECREVEEDFPEKVSQAKVFVNAHEFRDNHKAGPTGYRRKYKTLCVRGTDNLVEETTATEIKQEKRTTSPSGVGTD